MNLLLLAFLVLSLIGCTPPGFLPLGVSKELVPSYKSVLVVGCHGPEIGEFDHPTCLTIDKRGNLYVTDTGNHRVQGFNHKGEVISSFGGIDKLVMPTGITSFKKGLLVVDRARNLLLAFSLDGRLLNLDFSKEVNQFKDLNQVAWAKRRIFGVEGDRAICLKGEYLYITDIDKIKKFRIAENGELRLVLEFGGWGEEEGKFMLPQGLDVDRHGCIYVADTLNNRLQKFTPTGKFLLKITGLNRPMDVIVTKTGRLWILESGGHCLKEFVPEIEILIPKDKEDNHEWLYNRGRRFQSFGMFYHAISYYERCIEINPDSPIAPRAQLQIARSFKEIGDNEAAFMAYEEVIEDYPLSKEAPRALLEKGELLERLSLFEDALATYRRLIKEYSTSKENRKAERRIIYIEEKILG